MKIAKKNILLRAMPAWMMPIVACLCMMMGTVDSSAQCPDPCGPIPWVYKSQVMYIDSDCAPITVKWRVKVCDGQCNIEILSAEIDLDELCCTCSGYMSTHSQDMAAFLFQIELQILANYNTSPCTGIGTTSNPIVVRKPTCWRIIQGTASNGFVNKMEPCASSPCCERSYTVSAPGPGPGGPITITLVTPTTPPPPTDCSSLVPSNECKDVCRNMLDATGPWTE